MSEGKQRRFAADFKAKVALEALQGEQTLEVSEAQIKDLHAKIGQWRACWARWGWWPSTRSPTPPSPTRSVGATRTYYAVWRSPSQATSGADITYIPMRRGFLCLVAFTDWASRKALGWRLSNTLGADFCIEASRRHRPASPAL